MSANKMTSRFSAAEWYEGKFPADITAATTDAELDIVVQCEASDLEACAITLDASDVTDVHRLMMARRDFLRKG